MATFSTNQARQFFVCKSYGAVSAGSPVGQIEAKTSDGCLYFEYQGAGGALRTDLIPFGNGCKVNASVTPASKLARKLKSYKLSLAAGIDITQTYGEDFILGFTFYEWGAPGAGNQYYKDVCVRSSALNTSTASDFYTVLAAACTKSFSKESIPLLTFTVASDGVVINEVEQPWSRGRLASGPLNFVVSPRTITYGNEEITWGTLADQTSTTGVTVEDGKLTADLEWFCMGERGDTYRNVAYPYVIETEYLVDPTQKYHFVDIDFAYVGEGTAVQESRKMITIVFSEADKAAGNSLIGGINSTLSTSLAAIV